MCSSFASYTHPGKEEVHRQTSCGGGGSWLQNTRCALNSKHWNIGRKQAGRSWWGLFFFCNWNQVYWREIVRSGVNTHICSTESVDEGLSFSSGRLWSNTMVSVLARQNPLDRMISTKEKRYRAQYWISCGVSVTLGMSCHKRLLDMHLISWLDSESTAGSCGLCHSSAPGPAAIARRKSTSPLTWNTVESGF